MLIKNNKRTILNKYVSDIEHDVHGRQDMTYKMLRHLNRTERSVISENNNGLNTLSSYGERINWKK